MTERRQRCCPSCGYTEQDAKVNGDHRLCKNAGNAPWENASGAARNVAPDVDECHWYTSISKAMQFIDEDMRRASVLVVLKAFANRYPAAHLDASAPTPSPTRTQPATEAEAREWLATNTADGPEPNTSIAERGCIVMKDGRFLRLGEFLVAFDHRAATPAAEKEGE